MQKSQSPSLSTKEPGILVVMATLGQRPELLKLTLESIANQNIKNLDITFVYPLKNKETTQLAKQYNAKMIDDPGSMTAAVNAGIRTATAKHKYITWIGDDDLLAPNSLKKSIAALENDPDAVATFGYCDYIDDKGKYLFTSKAGRLAPWLMKWGPNLVPLPGAVFRLSTLQSMDYMFDESLRYAMDLDLFLRLQRIGKLVNVKRTVSSFRWHPTSTTVANRKASLAETEVIKRRNLPRSLQKIAPLWEVPVRFATHLAVRRVNAIANRRSAP